MDEGAARSSWNGEVSQGADGIAGFIQNGQTLYQRSRDDTPDIDALTGRLKPHIQRPQQFLWIMGTYFNRYRIGLKSTSHRPHVDIGSALNRSWYI